ncbi:WecB/TagA/CpsF family glycosyltransferase [Gordonia jinghuaiqii]|uniref:WecB/TagA/CpsF family glycosyltransferase n=1 Tax=Gordonia jinghuaiqii TaxID=2758710 RepID=A0A7D7LY03_9ACTN|nr:WecB/TagA/CpsF family glycosyltransferase [Gordonia jinghuaiqii]MCR5977924.1 WecB/TagA/CpsF family glycosyltransferase [Gordonia jinghuaiqii]QMT02578.1 WecB/TagA/CpsF family glycosyltransferase [Gordonia jinghuaiqii]
MNDSNVITWAGENLYIGGVPVVVGGIDDVLDRVQALVQSQTTSLVVTPNVDHLIRLETSEESRKGYAHADLALLDGVPVAKLASFLGSRPVQRNTGADLLFDVCRKAGDTGWRIVITGGETSVANLAASNLRDMTGADVLAVPFPFVDGVDDPASEEVVARLQELKPDVVFLCLGSPKQESWYAQWKESLPPAVYVGSGAAVDFAALKVRRAPQIVQRLALEWLWRLASEPKRLWRRYLLEGPKFLPIAAQAAWASETSVVQRELAAKGAGRKAGEDSPAADSQVVVQIGPEPTGAGGMATVIREYIEMDSGPYEQIAMPTWGSKRGIASLGLAAHVSLRLILTRNDWTIAHVHLSEFGSFIREGMVVLVARALRKPCVVTLHGADFDRHVEKYPRLTKLILKSATTAICLGRRHQRLVERIDPEIDTAIVLNPISSSLMTDDAPHGDSSDETPPTFVFAGEVGDRKGIDRLLNAWPLVEEAMPDARLLIAGPLEEGNSDVATKLLASTQRNVSYIGRLDRDDVTAHLAAATATVLPSRAEVLPMVILESLACGTPAVYSDVGEWETFQGLDEVTLVSLGDIDETQASKVLAEAMISCAREGEERQAVRESCREWARTHVSTAVVSDVLRSVYESQPKAPVSWTSRASRTDVAKTTRSKGAA